MAYNGLIVRENRKYFNSRLSQWPWTDIITNAVCHLHLKKTIFFPNSYRCAVRIKSGSKSFDGLSKSRQQTDVLAAKKDTPFVAG